MEADSFSVSRHLNILASPADKGPGQRGTGYYSPSGLLARSQSDGEDGEDGVVYVALNYRLGLFGFLNDVDGATPNVAILDQVLAFQW